MMRQTQCNLASTSHTGKAVACGIRVLFPLPPDHMPGALDVSAQRISCFAPSPMTTTSSQHEYEGSRIPWISAPVRFLHTDLLPPAIYTQINPLTTKRAVFLDVLSATEQIHTQKTTFHYHLHASQTYLLHLHTPGVHSATQPYTLLTYINTTHNPTPKLPK